MPSNGSLSPIIRKNIVKLCQKNVSIRNNKNELKVA